MAGNKPVRKPTSAKTSTPAGAASATAGGAPPAPAISTDLSESGRGGEVSGTAGAGGATTGSGAGGAASTERTVSGITASSLGITGPAVGPAKKKGDGSGAVVSGDRLRKRSAAPDGADRSGKPGPK